ncbi:MAG: MaoC/PaaZ C-terminal domain-containing protein [Myxococcota bacterium]
MTPPQAEAPPDDAFGQRTVTRDAVAQFAALTGDYARIHLDHHLGAQTPAGRGFAHGLLSASWALGALTLYRPAALGCDAADAVPSALAVRFEDVVHFDDTLHFCTADPIAADGLADPRSGTPTGFEVATQDGRQVTRGHLLVSREDPPVAPAPWRVEAAPPLDGDTRLGAEAVFAHGPRGRARVRTITESDVVGFCNFSGDLHPLYLDAPFAATSRFGARTVPPMLAFCLAFGSWLREFLRLPMAGGEMTAGHLGDRWRSVAPIYWGDTLEVRFRPERLRKTRSQPVRGVLTYGLQLVNQRGRVVQLAEVDLMLSI